MKIVADFRTIKVEGSMKVFLLQNITSSEVSNVDNIITTALTTQFLTHALARMNDRSIMTAAADGSHR